MESSWSTAIFPDRRWLQESGWSLLHRYGLCSRAAWHKYCCQQCVGRYGHDRPYASLPQHSPWRLRLRTGWTRHVSMESPFNYQQFHHLSFSVFRIPLLHCRCDHMRLLLRSQRLSPSQGFVFGEKDFTILLHARYRLARLWSLYRRYPHQHCGLRGCNRQACPSWSQIYLQRELLLRFHRCGWHVLCSVQDLPHPCDVRCLDGGW